MLKLTDFGLHQLRDTSRSVDESSYEFFKSKLWTAPELLAQDGLACQFGSRAADIYAFGIIMHEVGGLGVVFTYSTADRWWRELAPGAWRTP